MNIDLSKINNIVIDETIKLDPAYYENTTIRWLSDIKVRGNISSNNDDTYNLRLNISGEMILPCSISLVDVNYPFNIEIDELIDINAKENDEYIKIIANTLDIMPIIWQNIVVEIPLRVISPNLDKTKLQGDGWELIDEEKESKKIDPRLEKLKDLLDD